MIDDALRIKYPNLMERKPGTASMGQKWTLDNLRDGLQYFFEINGQYPSAWEINAFNYLPTSRSIQRSFGGLVALRTKLGLTGPLNYSKGVPRSKQAGNAYRRAQSQEEEFYNFLISKMPAYRVHEHKVLRPGNVSCDFFVYTTTTSGVAIDLFYAKDSHSASGSVIIKTKKYKHFPFPVFYVLVGNNNISQTELERLVVNKLLILPVQIRLLTEGDFKSNFDQLIKSKWI